MCSQKSISVADWGWSVNQVKVLMPSCLQNLRFLCFVLWRLQSYTPRPPRPFGCANASGHKFPSNWLVFSTKAVNDQTVLKSSPLSHTHTHTRKFGHGNWPRRFLQLTYHQKDIDLLNVTRKTGQIMFLFELVGGKKYYDVTVEMCKLKVSSSGIKILL